MPLSRERRTRCSLYFDLPAARRLQRLLARLSSEVPLQFSQPLLFDRRKRHGRPVSSGATNTELRPSQATGSPCFPFTRHGLLDSINASRVEELFLALHRAQIAARLSMASDPPLESGLTWSMLAASSSNKGALSLRQFRFVVRHPLRYAAGCHQLSQVPHGEREHQWPPAYVAQPLVSEEHLELEDDRKRLAYLCSGIRFHICRANVVFTCKDAGDSVRRPETVPAALAGARAC
jgi:hypothetical protein